MNETKKQVTQNPGRDDVHEQREHDQPREGVVEKPEKSTPAKPQAPDERVPTQTER